jgi:hypothetical protein
VYRSGGHVRHLVTTGMTWECCVRKVWTWRQILCRLWFLARLCPHYQTSTREARKSCVRGGTAGRRASHGEGNSLWTKERGSMARAGRGSKTRFSFAYPRETGGDTSDAAVRPPAFRPQSIDDLLSRSLSIPPPTPLSETHPLKLSMQRLLPSRHLDRSRFS